MTPTYTGVHVRRDADGAIRITTDRGSGPGGPVPDRAGDAADPGFGLAVLDAAGAVLTWPVLHGSGLPSAEVHDTRRAQQWLWALYGESVAAAVQDLASGEQGGVRVTAGVTALADGAARLAFGHWAARWWPASYTDGIPALDPGVLGLELAALTHRCHQLFDDRSDQPDDCAAELIQEHLAALDPLIQWWRAPSPHRDAGRRLGDVLRLIDDAADSTGLDGPELRRLRSALDRPGPAGATADPTALFARPDGYALAAGEKPAAGGRVIARGSGVNDWRRYPPGFVDAAEDAVSWTARALGARRRIEVEVLAHAAAPDGGASLVAEIQVDDGRPDRIPLARRDEVWEGRAGLDLPAESTEPTVEVGILLPGFDPGPGPEHPAGPDGATDRARRDAIRALARHRLAAADRPPAHDAARHRPFAPEPLLAETAAAATDEDY
ncbi:hypothetical protein [Streptomyces sp. NPDC049970]|uniref:hypothetical protein n=1 Tax=Streptomyces sp. NPDC049970 TaxID=3155033 RepID=UPI003432F567